MGSTKIKAKAKTALAAALLFCCLAALNGQEQPGNAGPGQLGAEIQNLERRLSAPGLSPAERGDAFSRLARLRQLSGDIAGAAANWLDAAAADPPGDAALMAGAYCYAATGEWDKAQSILAPLLSSGREGEALLQARYLDASLKALSSSGISSLAALAADPEFSALRPQIYYTLWQVITGNPAVSGAGSAESWRARLLEEFPQSPEARIADAGKNGAAIGTAQSPLWLLKPGAGNASPAAARPAPPPAPTPPPANRAGAAPAVVLQTGVFSREANARSQAEALRKAGFSASVSPKAVNGAEHWAVTVPGGQDSAKTAQELKKAGFDSFPVRSN